MGKVAEDWNCKCSGKTVNTYRKYNFGKCGRKENIKQDVHQACSVAGDTFAVCERDSKVRLDSVSAFHVP
jgi:hypothetical protein